MTLKGRNGVDQGCELRLLPMGNDRSNASADSKALMSVPFLIAMCDNYVNNCSRCRDEGMR